MEKVRFNSNGMTITGDLYLPADYENGKAYPALVVSGSWTTVKEQMPGSLRKRDFYSLVVNSLPKRERETL